MAGVDLIRQERRRQRSRGRGGEAYSLAHDDEHDKGEIARAAAVWYLRLDRVGPGERIRELVKAGALIAAEIDRLSRAGEC